ncbi:patatin-like phospholipase family protein [Rhizobium sp. TRM95796]|uniref:patatin-like phospholipase family protein n=1 Tax=Rhizobium sp. TRM95796 TaxID=2979862 RepID=UPI0021E803F3|nr:patatin-like phospholipase family protein [Rhizobium sp. TRM95796]MCV3766801.1 patatin-like phospholipase family protein [Rhizobium sp. TRM95796]
MITQGNSAPRVAIAFGGGGARGLAHIHVIEALDELGIRPVRITGSSIGAIMGAGMAAGLSGAEIRDFTLKTVGDPRAVMNRIWSLRPTTLQQFVSGGGFRVGQYNLERILKAFLPESLPEDFSGLAIPLGVIATDYYGEREVLIEQGALFPALAASAAIPAVFMPVMLDGRVMIDGGIYNPVPFDYLFDDADIVIGVDVVGAPVGEDQQIPRRIESVFGASQLMMQSIIAAKLKIRKPDILLRPNVGKIAVLDFMKAADILAMSADIKDELKRSLDAAIAFRA